MAKVKLIEVKDTDRYVKSGDVLLCSDNFTWLIIRLETADFLLYNLETAKYKILEKNRIKFELNGGNNPVPKKLQVTDLSLSRETTVRLDIVINKLSPCGAEDFKARILKGEDLTIKFEVPSM